jgi:uncharacterized protein YqeY
MGYRQDIDSLLKQALRNRDGSRVSTLRMLLSSLQYKEIEKKRELNQDEFHSLIKTLIKQRAESIELFKKGQRSDLVEKEEKELEILKGFVPAQMSDDELSAEVDAAVTELKATHMKEMGRVMKFLMEKLGSRVDGKVLNEMVRKRLSV